MGVSPELPTRHPPIGRISQPPPNHHRPPAQQIRAIMGGVGGDRREDGDRVVRLATSIRRNPYGVQNDHTAGQMVARISQNRYSAHCGGRNKLARKRITESHFCVPIRRFRLHIARPPRCGGVFLIIQAEDLPARTCPAVSSTIAFTLGGNTAVDIDGLLPGRVSKSNDTALASAKPCATTREKSAGRGRDRNAIGDFTRWASVGPPSVENSINFANSRYAVRCGGSSTDLSVCERAPKSPTDNSTHVY